MSRAISWNIHSQLNRRIMYLHSEMAKTQSIELTHDEVLDLIADPEDAFILKRAGVLTNLNSVDQTQIGYPVGGEHHAVIQATCRPHNGKSPPVLPARATARYDQISDSLRAKLNAWAELRMETAKGFSLAHYALDNLVSTCGSAQQMRFYWPVILTLCDGVDELKEFADKIRDFRAPKNTPSLPEDLRQACRISSGIITASKLIEAAPAPKAEAFANLTSMPSFEFCGKAVDRRET
ncbi:MAG TPA: hypothetical protein VKT73_15360 [Xanthobacteraceae bacterium]|nr:hypothetical protein [Xanthobacteraceae bacterium]